MRRAALLVMLLAAALGAGACGSGSSGVGGGTTGAATEPATARAVVYYVRGERVAPVARRVSTSEAPERAAMIALLAGPTASEKSAGLVTSIPAGTGLRGLRVTSEGVAEVDLSGEFTSGGGSASMLTRVAQVVFTLTGVRNVDAVRFLIDGKEVDAIGGEGVVVDHPMTRADVIGQAPGG